MGKIAGIERPEVVEPFADADQLDRQAELVGDRDRDSAFRGAVQLRQRDARDLNRLAEEPRLLKAVLAGRRVDHEQRLVWRALELLADHATNLRQLLHQVRLRVEAAGGVDHHDVPAPRLSGPDRVERDRCRSAAPPGSDEGGACARGPAPELRLGRGTESVRSGDDDRAPVLAELRGELADRGRLAGAVDADDEDHARPLVEVEPTGFAQHAGDLLLQAGGKVTVAAGLEPLNELGGRGHAPLSRAPRPPARAPRAGSPAGSPPPSASSAVSARRLLPSESRSREKKPERSASSAAVPSSPSSSAQLRAIAAG